MKSFKEFILEKDENKEKEERKPITYEVTAFDDAKSLKKILDCIKAVGNTGHTFNVVIDPEGEDVEKRTFQWDGDGSDHIKGIKEIETEEEPSEEPAEEPSEEPAEEPSEEPAE